MIAGANIIDAAFMILAAFSLIVLFSLGLNEPDIFLILAVVNLIVTTFVLISFQRSLPSEKRKSHLIRRK